LTGEIGFVRGGFGSEVRLQTTPDCFLLAPLVRYRSVVRMLSSVLAATRPRWQMAKWILICAKCKTEFEHSQISDVGMASLIWLAKPEFAPTGNECVCPQCGYSATYLRTDLLYKA
jgi:hypothetical protein